MKLAYICSPYKGENKKEIKENIKKAEKISKETYKQLDMIPICVHTFLEKTTGLNEKKGDRKELLYIGKEIVKRCDYVIINQEKTISEGMIGEIEEAKRNKKKIIIYQKGEFYK